MTVDNVAAFYLIFILAVPALLKWAEPKYKFFSIISPVIVCYGLGMLIGNVPLFGLNTTLSSEVSNAAVPLAMALLLFTTDFLGWLKQGGKAIWSFVFCIVSVSVAVVLASHFFSSGVEESHKVGAMMIGVYTGGTPNLASIGKALEMPDDVFTMLNGFDTVLSSLYLLFVITIGQTVLHWFLPKYRFKGKAEAESEEVKNSSLNMIWSVLLGGVCLGVSVGFSLLVFGKILDIVAIIGTTTVAIAFSFIPKVRKLKESYFMGDYFILVACMGFGFMTNFNTVIESGGAMFGYCAIIMTVSILIHYVLAAIARIDADTVLVTSIAAIFGPAFVGLISSRLKNPELMAPGVSTGLMGYALANYIGIGMAYLLA